MPSLPDRRKRQILYLLRRKFPDGKALKKGSSSRIEFERGDIYSFYEEELNSKIPQELDDLFNQEKAKEADEQKVKAEREEKQRFFNQPHAEADYDHWSKMAYWTLDEAVALSFGKGPDIVNWESVKPYVQVSPFAKEYFCLRDLVQRAETMEQLYHGVTPSFFLAWAKQNEITYPPELEAAVTARGELIQDWKTLYTELEESTKRKIDEALALFEESRDERRRISEELERMTAAMETLEAGAPSVTTRERDSLLKLIVGMAVEQYGFNPHAAKNSATKNIADDLAGAGVPLDPDTVRKWLKEAAELLPPQTDQDVA